MENWKPVEGYEGLYEVSDAGNVRNARTGCAKSLRPGNKTGHLHVYLSRRGSVTTLWVHRLVAKAFVPNPDGLPLVMHLDDDPTNNAASNLRWGTQKQNMAWNDVRAVMSRAHGGRPVVQLDRDGNAVATYQTVMDAERATGIGHTKVFGVLKGRHKSAGGYVWKYA